MIESTYQRLPLAIQTVKDFLDSDRLTKGQVSNQTPVLQI